MQEHSECMNAKLGTVHAVLSKASGQSLRISSEVACSVESKEHLNNLHIFSIVVSDATWEKALCDIIKTRKATKIEEWKLECECGETEGNHANNGVGALRDSSVGCLSRGGATSAKRSVRIYLAKD